MITCLCVKVGNTAGYDVADWKKDILLAQAAHIDAFALNIAAGDATNAGSIQNAFDAAVAVGGFKLFFSFDYAGNGPWDLNDVSALLKQYAVSGSYYQHNGKPFVSTFEGPLNALDWTFIKEEIDVFFVPDWSSIGASPAVDIGKGIIDGLFSWAAWPTGPADMNTYIDASYLQYLSNADGLPYMMAVSPWFFTNMPGYDKNWLWRGDKLWYDRWQEVNFLQPEFVEIISWNDYGESHYIGPLPTEDLEEDTYVAFETGEAPFNYVKGMPHEAWLDLLPFSIDHYKNNISYVTQETVVAWYRLGPGAACSGGVTTGNTASQLQLEYEPYQIMQDKVFFSALLGSAAQFTITIGGASITGDWDNKPYGGAGLYHGSVDFTGHSGSVTVSITRNGAVVAQMVNGKAITTGCAGVNGVQNFNPWVGSGKGNTVAKTATYSLTHATCIAGWGAFNFAGLCDWSCAHGYCPVGACLCTAMGPQPDLPEATHPAGYPIAGESADYSGLCGFACPYGYCPPEACGSEPHALVVYDSSPFLPAVPTAGSGDGDLAGLCSFSCNYGFCPMHNCTTTQTGVLVPQPGHNTSVFGAYWNYEVSDSGLCNFACQHGYCPEGTCFQGLTHLVSCGSDDDYDSDECIGGTTECDWTLRFVSMDDLESAADDLETVCTAFYALDVVDNMLTDTLNTYEDVNNGYDDKFGYYVKYIKELVPSALEAFMSSSDGAGNKYFTCSFEVSGTNRTVKTCPIDDSVTAGTTTWTMYYTLNDEKGFFDELLSTYGVKQDWVQFGTTQDKGTGCLGGPNDAGCDRHSWTSKGIPVAADTITVDNPKDLITESLPNIAEVQAQLHAAQFSYLFGDINSTSDDLIQTFSMPIFLLAQAVDNMAQVKDIGETEEETEKKELIMTIVSALLCVVPFVGEVGAGLAGLTNLVRVIALAGIAGNSALSVYDVVEDPQNLPAAMLGLVLSGVGGGASGAQRTGRDFEEAASLRRSMPSDDVKKIGATFAAHDDQLQRVLKACSAS